VVRRSPLLAAGLIAAFTATGAPLAAQDTTSAPAAAQRRADLERRLTARIGEVVRERLGLTAEQAQRLQEVDQRYHPERRRLMQQESEVRRGVRAQIAAGDNADQRATAALLDRFAALQRERLELQSREQAELAAFLTPVQRAKLLGLQADLHRRVMIMRRGRPHRRGAHPPGDSMEHRGMRPPGIRRGMGPP
jgi:protein CpxP